MKSQPITRNLCVFTRFWMENNLQPQSPRLRDAENTENCDENDAVKWKWFCVRADENNNKKDRHKARIIIQSHWHLSLTLIRLLFAKNFFSDMSSLSACDFRQFSLAHLLFANQSKLPTNLVFVILSDEYQLSQFIYFQLNFWSVKIYADHTVKSVHFLKSSNIKSTATLSAFFWILSLFIEYSMMIFSRASRKETRNLEFKPDKFTQ